MPEQDPSVTDYQHITYANVSRVLLAVINEAARIEPDAINLLRWYGEDPIESLGGRTAEQLVSSGHGELVVRFLRHINSSAICCLPISAPHQ
jgi:hypothetical protein